jgi:membrane-associated phospholipid phosphatase
LLLIIIGVVAFHLFEVHFIDPVITDLIGTDFAPDIQAIEDNLIIGFTSLWTPILVYFFVIMYIVIYPFTLWFSPLYYLTADEHTALKTLAYGLLCIYLIALPFYLFLPITNVYLYYGETSALASVIPTIDEFFYSTTTINNTFPSLHVAMTLLIAKTASKTANKKYQYFTYFCAVSVILSVMYLAIHWLTDVVFGIILAFGVGYLLDHYLLGRNP